MGAVRMTRSRRHLHPNLRQLAAAIAGGALIVGLAVAPAFAANGHATAQVHPSGAALVARLALLRSELFGAPRTDRAGFSRLENEAIGSDDEELGDNEAPEAIEEPEGTPDASEDDQGENEDAQG